MLPSSRRDNYSLVRLDTAQIAEKDLFFIFNYGRVGFYRLFCFLLYFFCYEKTEPLAIDFYSFGFCFSILHPSAIEQDFSSLASSNIHKSIQKPRNNYGFRGFVFYLYYFEVMILCPMQFVVIPIIRYLLNKAPISTIVRFPKICTAVRFISLAQIIV